jgi:hypothetical protein
MNDMIIDFVGSNTFSILMILAVIALGVGLRLTFSVPDSKEYKHRRED